MKRTTLLMIGAALVFAALGAYWAYDAVLGESLAPSAPISAVPLEVKTETPSATAASATAVETLPARSTERPSLPSTPEATLPPTPASDSGGVVVYQIVSAESQASFMIYEELAGQPTNVLGVTNQVAGEVALNLADLSQAQFGVIQINARTLATDSNRRNQAIRNRILNTDQYEFITFAPKQVIGLSGSAVEGQPLTFQIVGDLTIRDVTQPVTFDVTVTGESQTRINGLAVAVIRRADYRLTIPSVPQVANVSEEVTLELQFVLSPVTP